MKNYAAFLIFFSLSLPFFYIENNKASHTLPQIFNNYDIVSDIDQMRKQRIQAPDFPDELEWLNTLNKLQLKALRGKVILLDFWSVSCLNCSHVLPDIQYLQNKYKDNGFLIIGVHSGKYLREQNKEIVRQAIFRDNIEFPVVIDQDFKIWQAYAVNSWPTFILIGADGMVAGYFTGEGQRKTLDTQINLLLAGADPDFPRPEETFYLEQYTEQKEILRYPEKILADPVTNKLYIADTYHNRIIVADTLGQILDIIGNGRTGHVDGYFESASFNKPHGMAFYKNFLIVADTENHLIRKIDFTKRSVSTIAGSGYRGYFYSPAMNNAAADFNTPWDIQFIKDKAIISMAGTQQLWRLDMISGKVDFYAGNGSAGKTDSIITESTFARPKGMSYDGENIFIADSESGSIRKINLYNRTVETIAGGGLYEYGDITGTATQARFQLPTDVVYKDSLLFIADFFNNKIKTIDTRSGLVTNLTGTGRAGHKDGHKAEFNGPSSLSVLDNKLYLTDTFNNSIRVVDMTENKVSTLTLKDNRMHYTSLADVNNSQEVTFSKTLLACDGKLIIHIHLPDSSRFTKNSVVQYLVKSDNNGIEMNQAQIQTINDPEQKIEIPFTQAATSSNSTFNVELVYYTNSVKKNNIKCHSFIYKIPVHFSNNGIKEFNIFAVPS